MQKKDCLTWTQVQKVYGSSIIKLAPRSASVAMTTSISDLAEAFQAFPDLLAVGVLDDHGDVIGLISRLQLFSLLGKPYGRDVMGKKSVSHIVEQVKVFSAYTSIFQVSTELGEHINDQDIKFYLIKDLQGKFGGIFSSRDMLVYLSRITREDISLAADLQERMFKRHEEWSGAGWLAQAFSKPALGVGGDFYAYRDMGHGRHFFAIGDVSGKGVAANILTSLLWGILRSWDFDRGLKSLLLHINRALLETFHLEKYLTGIFFILDEKKNVLQFADMGHGHMVLLRKGRPKLIKGMDMNLPLGIDLVIEPKMYRIELKSGDSLSFWTDGLTEQVNPSGEEFGDQRFIPLLVERSSYADIPLVIQQSVDDWRQGFPQHDDMTWLHLSIAKH